MRKTLDEMRQAKSGTDWARVEKMMADGTETKAEGDFDISEGRFVRRGALIGRPKLKDEDRKVGTYIRFSPRVLNHLRASGKNWQTRLSKKVEELVDAGEL
ncbi:MAG: BrnA antitoxin family protein [Treponema sp.]|nr:BrnA antitoxin family protein [Treponema sp.]